MGVSLFVAVVYITINFVVDVLYGVIDPGSASREHHGGTRRDAALAARVRGLRSALRSR